MSKKKEKGKKKRDLEKYPALNPRLNAKTRFEVLDMDYLKRLEDTQLKYLNQFMAEYVSGAFKKDENGEYSKDNIHATVEQRRECYTRNNTRNRCGLTVSNATGQTIRMDNINDFVDVANGTTESTTDVNLFSDKIIDDYDGDYELLEEAILNEMIEDYKRCVNPKNKSDKIMAESSYGKMLLLKFNGTEFN
jgi:hypothetical protein